MSSIALDPVNVDGSHCHQVVHENPYLRVAISCTLSHTHEALRRLKKSPLCADTFEGVLIEDIWAAHYRDLITTVSQGHRNDQRGVLGEFVFCFVFLAWGVSVGLHILYLFALSGYFCLYLFRCYSSFFFKGLSHFPSHSDCQDSAAVQKYQGHKIQGNLKNFS